MTKLFWQILNWLFPLTCVVCGEEGLAVCDDCWDKVETREVQECPYCRQESRGGVSCCERKESRLIDGLNCLWNYQSGNALARLLYFYKYEGMKEYGKALLKEFGDIGMEIIGEAWEQAGVEFDLVTWVPLSRQKWKKRGFNQSEELAKSLGMEAISIPLLDKITETKAQMTLNRQERLKNLHNAFVIKPEWREKLSGKRILVIDDIATTLSTLEEVASTLKTAGCSKVYGLVGARQKD